jgi:eukaryotic-like serine/threonine-protein kinase
MSRTEHPLRVARGELPIGTIFDGRFKSTGLLGRGGFSVVYDGVQLQLDRPVAIKVMAQGLEHEVIKRFFREAKTAARIQHPNVVRIYDYGIMGKIPYIVMEPFSGHDFDEELAAAGAMEAARYLPLFAECLGGLGAAHKQGIVHKDLKPCNLVLTDPMTPREALRIIDFGTAALVEGQERLTRTGAICGTAMYMAPEYVQHRAVTPALDVYQMGLILVEGLTGRPAITGESPYDCLVQHISGDLAVPAALRDGPLGAVINRALALDPRDRYADAGEMRKALYGLELSSMKVSLPRVRMSQSVAPLERPAAADRDDKTTLDVAAIYDSQVTRHEVLPAATIPFATPAEQTRVVTAHDDPTSAAADAVGLGLGTLTLLILAGLVVAAVMVWSVWAMQSP